MQLLQEVQEGPHQKKTKTKKNIVKNLVQREVTTVKTNCDTEQALALDMPPIVHAIQHKSPTAMDHVNQSGMTSNLLASGKSSMDTQGAFYCLITSDMQLLQEVQEGPHQPRIQEMENAADMMRTSIMALRCEEEDISKVNQFEESNNADTNDRGESDFSGLIML